MRSGSKPTSGISRKMPSYRLSGKAEEDLFEIAIFGIGPRSAGFWPGLRCALKRELFRARSLVRVGGVHVDDLVGLF